MASPTVTALLLLSALGVAAGLRAPTALRMSPSVQRAMPTLSVATASSTKVKAPLRRKAATRLSDAAVPQPPEGMELCDSEDVDDQCMLPMGVTVPRAWMDTAKLVFFFGLWWTLNICYNVVNSASHAKTSSVWRGSHASPEPHLLLPPPPFRPSVPSSPRPQSAAPGCTAAHAWPRAPLLSRAPFLPHSAGGARTSFPCRGP